MGTFFGKEEMWDSGVFFAEGVQPFEICLELLWRGTTEKVLVLRR